MSEPNTELKNIVEAALLVAGQPLTIDKMLAMFPEGSQPAREDIRAVLDALAAEYTARGVELRQIGSGWRIQTREKYAEYVARLLEERPQRYTRALLETLAIIAYRQPVTRGEIEHIRGVSVSTDIVRTLTERGWIKEVGRRDVPGRPALLGTTREFLEHFNLRSLEDMPPLAELRSLEEVGAELERREISPAAPDRDAPGTPSDLTDTIEAAAEMDETDTASVSLSPHDPARV
ncbi:MAG: SMC-Scp complex subunit ScpB [Pseudomonadota bacterium]